MRLTHTRLLVTDFPSCFRSYRDALGLSAQMGNENDPYAEFLTGSTTLALFGRPAMAEAIGDIEKPLDAVSHDRAALIFEVDDVDAVFAQLKGRGWKLPRSHRIAQDGESERHADRDPSGSGLSALSRSRAARVGS